MTPARSCSAYFEALRSERTIAAVDAHTDVRTKEFSAPYLTPLGIGAMLDAPIRVGGRMIGVICNEQLGGPRAWTVGEELLASALADHVAMAVLCDERRNAEQQLKLLVHELEQVR
jgi:GAF domain-containing protein